MKPKPLLGSSDDSEVRIDLERLIESRMLLQANSGGGKSWALRRILEQTHGQVQQLVIDLEDEFHTLREKFDYVLARPGGDCPVEVRSAGLLARRLLELGVSAVISINDLKHHERLRFVKLFLETLIEAPRALWHSTLVVIDEGHIFCPQKDEAESTGAVIDLMTRGRKRGFCGVLATQRISKLHKDAAAEANNYLVGRSALDLDAKRAADLLGFSGKEAEQRLRSLKAGHFFAFGPAILDQVQAIVVGPVQTTHPKAGQRHAAAPPPTETVRRVLAQLADLPKEAEEEARTIDDFRRQVTQLKRELAQKPKPELVVDETALANARELGREDVRRVVLPIFSLVEKLRVIGCSIEPITVQCNDTLAAADKVVMGPAPAVETKTARPETIARVRETIERPREMRRPNPETAAGNGIQPVQQRILDAIAELEVLGIAKPPRSHVALMAGYTNVTSKGFANAIGALRTDGLIAYPSHGSIALTADGRRAAQPAGDPMDSEELQGRIIRMLDPVHGRILRELIALYPESLQREDLAARAGYTNVTSKGFANAIGRLRGLGLIDYPDRGQVKAQPALFLS